MDKSIFKSKTFWVAMITLGLGVIEAIQGQIETGATISVIGVANVVLRIVTKEAVKWEFWK